MAKEPTSFAGEEKPTFTTGIIADIQYAPIPDGHSYSGVPRYYRHAAEVARHAFEHFEEEKADMAINLGDIIDGKSKNPEDHGGETPPDGMDGPDYALGHVLDALSPYSNGPVLHIHGNHCLYNFDRKTLRDRLGIPFKKEPCGELVGYYSYIRENVRFIALDGYDIAFMKRHPESSRKRLQAASILQAINPNFPGNFNAPEGLEGKDRRFVGFNGSIGPLQLAWLERSLEEARSLNQTVIILSHQIIHPDSGSHMCLIWNYEKVLEILRDYSDVVAATFSGHAHKGGYCRDKVSGIHFRVVEAVLECRPERTYAMLDVYPDRLVVRGFGNCKSGVYDLSHIGTTGKKSVQEAVSYSWPMSWFVGKVSWVKQLVVALLLRFRPRPSIES
eukprot:Nitzschia sp. Nitz4//scaffold38_size140716//28746//29912//NITZ4_003130-RA/size140716-processed-gene-0.27-mRNA-1//1//CDS//3329550027//8139//frame0